MKAKDSVRTSTLRMLIASFRNKEIEKKKTLGETDVLDVIQAEAKRRREAMDEYSKVGRADLASKEEAELNVLKVYLPAPLSETELKAIIQAAVKSSGAKSPQDMGKVMSAIMPQIKGKADGKTAQKFVLEALK
jgi:uncharacterized protein YqeY